MEFVPGQDLKLALSERRGIDVPGAALIMIGVLQALSHAHASGITHRDIKPANIMLLPDGSIKMTDFGIARVDDGDATLTSAVVGTPQYMAPEQLSGGPVDGRTDLHACGLVLYELLTGRKPFATLQDRLSSGLPSPPSKMNADLVVEWDSVVLKATAPNPGDRFQSADAFIASIEAAMAGSVVGGAALAWLGLAIERRLVASDSPGRAGPAGDSSASSTLGRLSAVGWSD